MALKRDDSFGTNGFWGSQSKNGVEEYWLGQVVIIKSESKPKAFDGAIKIADGVWIAFK